MKVAGIEKNSFVDWPGRVAAVLFTPGCNLDCGYCHNRALLEGGGWFGAMSEETLLEWLGERNRFLDGVVLSGGEPTIQAGLGDYIRSIRALGLAVKLDTNGTRPDVLRSLLDADLLEYVAMDLKAPVEKYEGVCGVRVDHRAVNASIDLLLAGRIDYEFRTTLVPQLTSEDLAVMARRIDGARRYVVQRYRPGGAAGGGSAFGPAPEWLGRFIQAAGETIETVQTRGFDLSQLTVTAA